MGSNCGDMEKTLALLRGYKNSPALPNGVSSNMAGRGNRFLCSSGVLLFRYCLTVNDKRDRGRADFGDPESVPDTGGAEGAAEQPSQRHDEEDIAAQRDDQRRHSLAQTFQRTGRGGGHRRHDEAEADDTERLCTDGDRLRVRAEQADQGAGDGEAEHRANGHDGGAETQREAVELCHTAMHAP